MGERVRAALLTYVRRRWLLAGGTVSILVYGALLFDPDLILPWYGDWPFLSLLFWIVHSALFMGIHLEGRVTLVQGVFAWPESKLIPGFASAHAVAALLIAIPFFVIGPSLVAWRFGHSLFGAISLSILAAIVGWTFAHSLFSILVIPLFAAFWILVTVATRAISAGDRHVEPFASILGGDADSLAAIALGFAVAVLTVLSFELICLPRRMEELPGEGLIGFRHPHLGITYLSLWKMDDVFARRLDRIRGTVSRGLWARARLRAIAWPHPATYAVSMALVFMMRYMHANWRSVSPPSFPELSMLSGFFAFIPVVAMRVWSVLDMELLRPASRPRFLTETALAMAMQLAKMWLVLAGIDTVLCGVLEPETLQSGRYYAFLAASACLQIPLLGLALLSLSSRLWIVWALPGLAILCMVPIVAMLLGTGEMPASAPYSLAAAGVLLALGLILLRAAFRRWMRCDQA